MKKELDAFAAGYYGKFKVRLLFTKLLMRHVQGSCTLASMPVTWHAHATTGMPLGTVLYEHA